MTTEGMGPWTESVGPRHFLRVKRKMLQKSGHDQKRRHPFEANYFQQFMQNCKQQKGKIKRENASVNKAAVPTKEQSKLPQRDSTSTEQFQFQMKKTFVAFTCCWLARHKTLKASHTGSGNSFCHHSQGKLTAVNHSCAACEMLAKHRPLPRPLPRPIQDVFKL